MPTKKHTPSTTRKTVYKSMRPKRMHIEHYPVREGINIASTTLQALMFSSQGTGKSNEQRQTIATKQYVFLAGIDQSLLKHEPHLSQMQLIQSYFTKDSGLAKDIQEVMNRIQQIQIQRLAQCAQLFEHDNSSILGKDGQEASIENPQNYLNAFNDKYMQRLDHRNKNHYRQFSFSSGICRAIDFFTKESLNVSLFDFACYNNYLLHLNDWTAEPNYAHLSGLFETTFYVCGQRPDIHHRNYATTNPDYLFHENNLVQRDHFLNPRINILYQILALMEDSKKQLVSLDKTKNYSLNRFYLYAILYQQINAKMDITSNNHQHVTPPIAPFNLMPTFMKLLSRNHHVVQEILQTDISSDLPKELQTACNELRQSLMRFKHTTRVRITCETELNVSLHWRWYEKLARKFEHYRNFLETCSQSLKIGMGASYLGVFKVIPWIILSIVLYPFNPKTYENDGSFYSFGFGMRKPERLMITANKIMNAVKSKSLEPHEQTRLCTYLKNFVDPSDEKAKQNLDDLANPNI